MAEIASCLSSYGELGCVRAVCTSWRDAVSSLAALHAEAPLPAFSTMLKPAQIKPWRKTYPRATFVALSSGSMPAADSDGDDEGAAAGAGAADDSAEAADGGGSGPVDSRLCERPGPPPLGLLEGMTSLTSLRCWQLGRSVTDAGLHRLGNGPPASALRLTGLASLKLSRSDTAVTPEGLRGLCGLSHLTSLSLLFSSALTDEACGAIAALPALKELSLSTALECRGHGPELIEAVAGCTCFNGPGPDGMAELVRMTALTSLSLASLHNVAAASLDALGQLPSLTTLRLESVFGPDLVERPVEHGMHDMAGLLRGLTQLQELSLTYLPWMASGAMLHIGALPRLRCLSLDLVVGNPPVGPGAQPCWEALAAARAARGGAGEHCVLPALESLTLGNDNVVRPAALLGALVGPGGYVYTGSTGISATGSGEARPPVSEDEAEDEAEAEDKREGSVLPLPCSRPRHPLRHVRVFLCHHLGTDGGRTALRAALGPHVDLDMIDDIWRMPP